MSSKDAIKLATAAIIGVAGVSGMIQNEYDPPKMTDIQQQTISDMYDALKDNEIQDKVDEPKVNN